MQPSLDHSLALDMAPKDQSAYLCTSYSSKSTCFDDCHLHGTIKNLSTLVINSQSICKNIEEIEILLGSVNPDIIIGND